MKKIILGCIFVLLFLSGCSHKYNIPTTNSVNLEKYQGIWYEIARYENSFEKGCIGASAQYKLENEKVLVTNRCFDEKGWMIGEANGNAYSTNETNTKLKVSFFWPFYGDYWIIKLANDYRYSIVSEPTKKYLWILSRSKKLQEKDKREILNFLVQNGYETHLLYWAKME